MKKSLFSWAALATGLSLMALPSISQAQCKLNFDMSKWEVMAFDDFGGPIDTINNVPLNPLYWRTSPEAPATLGTGWGAEWYPGTNLVTVSRGAAHIMTRRLKEPSGQLYFLDRKDPKMKHLYKRPYGPDSTYLHPNTSVDDTRNLAYESGMLYGLGNMRQPSFGAWEARLKLPTNVMVCCPAFWLWTCPTEVDIIDGADHNNSRGNASAGFQSGVVDWRLERARKGDTCSGLARYNPDTVLQGCGQRTREWTTNADSVATLLTGSYHTYTVVWTPEVVTFFLDGREIQSIPKSVVATVSGIPDFYLSMQTWGGAEFDMSAAEATMDVDYVRILKPRCTLSAPSSSPYGGTEQYLCNTGDPTKSARDFSQPPSSYKWTSGHINHDVSVTRTYGNFPFPTRPGISSVSGQPGSIAVDPTNPNLAFYRGVDNKIYIATATNGTTWSVDVLPSDPNNYTAWDAIGEVTYNTGLQYVVYCGPNGTLQGYAFAGGTWNHIDFYNYNIFKKPLLRVKQQAGSITHLHSATDPAIFFLTPANQIYCWQPNSLRLISTNTDPNNAVLGDIVAHQGSRNVIYKGGNDNRLHLYWLGDGAYQHSLVDADWSNASLASSKPKSVCVGGDNIYYIGADNKIHRYAFTSANGWTPTLLPVNYTYGNPGGYYNADLAKGGIDCNPDGTYVVYVGYDGRLQSLYQNNGVFTHAWTDDYWNTEEFESFLDTSNEFPSTFSSGNATFYCGKDHHLRYFAWEPCENARTQADCTMPKQMQVNLHRSATPVAPTPLSAVTTRSLDKPTVSPNPTTGQVDLYMPAVVANESVPFAIYSSVGIVVKQGALHAAHTTLDLAEYQQGIYLVVVHSQAQTYSLKIIKN